MISSEQIRGARAMLGWSAKLLAEKTGLSLRTIQKLESSDGHGAGRKSSLLAVKAVFEAAGIEFIGAPDDAPGIRMHGAPKA